MFSCLDQLFSCLAADSLIACSLGIAYIGICFTKELTVRSHVVCRDKKKPYLLIDFSVHLRISVYELNPRFPLIMQN